MPSKGVHAEANADGGGNDGLHIGVHAHQGGAYALLTNGDKEVSDEGCTHNEVGKLKKVC